MYEVDVLESYDSIQNFGFYGDISQYMHVLQDRLYVDSINPDVSVLAFAQATAGKNGPCSLKLYTRGPLEEDFTFRGILRSGPTKSKVFFRPLRGASRTPLACVIG